jgi:hypothetical protein
MSQTDCKLSWLTFFTLLFIHSRQIVQMELEMDHDNSLQIRNYFFLRGATTLFGNRPPHWWSSSIIYIKTHHNLQYFPGPTQRSVPDKHTTFTRDKHPCTLRESNPNFQPVSGRRPRGHWNRADSHLPIIPVLFHAYSTSHDVSTSFTEKSVWRTKCLLNWSTNALTLWNRKIVY